MTVTDNKGNLVTGLTAEDFVVTEDGRPQTVRYFAGGDGSGPPAPEMHLGLLLDVSESMGEDLGFTKTAAIKFLNTLTDAADITVVDFDTQVRVGRYGQSDFARLIERIRQQKASGNTALYDAIGMYLDGAHGQNGRKIMLLYTDGGDTRSAMRFGELLDLLKASDVTVYVIGVLRAPDASRQGRPAADSAADGRGDGRPGVLPAVGQEPRLGIRQSARRDSGAVHGGICVDERQGGRHLAEGRAEGEP